MTENKKGKLICVGTGMRMAGQLTPIAKSYIETADVVIAAVPNVFTRKWLQGIAKEYICLLSYYAIGDEDGKNRRDTYDSMVATIVEHLRAGKTVCAAFYGHPGIFACISHKAIAQAREEGFAAHMEPGVSAEDCLVADIGIDPGEFGSQAMETTQFMIYQRRIDPSALLILWQPGLAGDLSLKKFDTTPQRLQILVDKLARDYPPEHEVILYEAATHPMEKTRMDRVKLKDLPHAELKQITTLVIPPAVTLQLDQAVVTQLQSIAQQ